MAERQAARCPRCGSAARAEDQRCPRCGALLASVLSAPPFAESASGIPIQRFASSVAGPPIAPEPFAQPDRLTIAASRAAAHSGLWRGAPPHTPQESRRAVLVACARHPGNRRAGNRSRRAARGWAGARRPAISFSRRHRNLHTGGPYRHQPGRLYKRNRRSHRGCRARKRPVGYGRARRQQAGLPPDRLRDAVYSRPAGIPDL